ncbi:MAG: 50S ribosomal protein L11 methyltransferase [Bacteroidales bacterium]|nr:50S ribosomal protein L11 methyltransferase [Bacteroidales bacterium]
MNYIELSCLLTPYSAESAEIIIAYLSQKGFESFSDEEPFVKAWITEDLFTGELQNFIKNIQLENTELSFEHRLIKEQNWNETWEKNYFEPILIADKCIVRSTFHENTPKLKYEILIDPKMSFGTGHHETTSLMIEEILELDVQGKTILDMGCGTGILAILSAQKGAKEICAIDIDKWSYNNTLENLQLNSIKNVHVEQGDKSNIGSKFFNIIYANINKNVLLHDIPDYAAHIHHGGKLLLSGFYAHYFEEINKIAQQSGLQLSNKREKNNWIMLSYIKGN